MRKIIFMNKFITFSAIILLAFCSAFADESPDVVVKLKGVFSTSHFKQSGMPTPYTNFAKTQGAANTGKVYNSGYGVEASVGLFLTDNFAGELSSGLVLYKSKATALNALAVNYNNSPNTTKARNLYTIPTSLTLQYHIAPYGAIRPYIGGGMHYSYMIPRTSQLKVQNGSGPIIQAGVDVVFKDDTYINLDVKQYFMNTKVKYNQSFITDQKNKQITSKLKMDPLVIGLGIGFKL